MKALNSSTQTNQQDAAVENHSQSRLFTFGCSFTKYKWPTWADIIGREFSEHQNWGTPGAGNCFILWSLAEAIERNAIGPDDTVAIMWTNVTREDRWVDGSWITPGSIYTQGDYNPYSTEFIKQFADPDGYLIRDMANISSARRMLQSIGCRYYMMSMVPFEITSPVHPSFLQKIKSKFLWITGEPRETIREEFSADPRRILSVYKNTLIDIRPSVFDVIFKGDWLSRKGLGKGTAWIMDDYQKARETWAKEHNWPEFSDLLDGKITDQTLESVKKYYGFSDISEFIDQIERLEKRDDIHPTPLEHLEYINRVLPEIRISEETREWTKSMQERAERGEFYTSTVVTRF